MVLEELPGGKAHSRGRFKRSSDDPALVVVYESAASLGECGIKPWNVKKMKKPRQDAVLLNDLEERDDSLHDKHAVEFEEMARELEGGGGGDDEEWSLLGAFYSGKKARVSHFNEDAYREASFLQPHSNQTLIPINFRAIPILRRPQNFHICSIPSVSSLSTFECFPFWTSNLGGIIILVSRYLALRVGNTIQ